MSEKYLKEQEVAEIAEIAKIAAQKAQEMSELATLLAEKHRCKAQAQNNLATHPKEV